MKSFPTSSTHDVVLLTFEITGFQDLTDIYYLSYDHSLDDMAEDINDILSGLFTCIIARAGDIVSYNGITCDCIWQTTEGHELETLKNVVETALFLQNKYGKKTSKTKIPLKIVIGISIGIYKVLYVGDQSERIYFVGTGDVVVEALLAKSLCPFDQITLSPIAWKLFGDDYSSKFIWKRLSDDYIQIYSKSMYHADINNTDEYLKARMRMLKDSEVKHNKDLKKFTAASVRIPSNCRQFSILDSFSQVTMIVVHVRNIKTNPPEELQSVVAGVQEIINEYKGTCCNILYNKHFTIIVSFGTPGYRHHNDSLMGLMCAQGIIERMKVMNISVVAGVITSMTFCGILGPLERLQYLFIGKCANLAHQVILSYPDSDIVCCSNTYFRTWREIGDEYFIPLKKKPWTFKSTSVFYSFQFCERDTDMAIFCVGRTAEKKLITNCLRKLKEDINDLGSQLPLIVLKGPLGVGKSYFLKWIYHESQDLGFTLRSSVHYYEIPSEFLEPCGTGWQIVKSMLRNKRFNSEAKISELFGEDAENYPLHLLNKWLNTKYPDVEVFSRSKDGKQNMLLFLMQKCCYGNSSLIVIDDADGMDEGSWYFIQDILITRLACVAITIAVDFKPTSPFVENIINQSYKEILLGPLDEDGITSLACLYLGVEAVHKAILQFLKLHCHGNAMKLEEILMLPQLQQHICIVQYGSITKTTLEKNFCIALESFCIDPEEMKACDVLAEEDLDSITVPRDLIDVVKEHTSELNPEEMMIAKKCACLGEPFLFPILKVVSPEYKSVNEVCDRLNQLCYKNIFVFCCDHLKISGKKSFCHISIEHCGNENICFHPVCFKSDIIREYLINTMTPNQKRNLHLLLVSLLEVAIKERCSSCKDKLSRDEVRTPCYGQHQISNYDLRFCQCLILKKLFYSHMEYHLMNGGGSFSQRIKCLFEAIEISLLDQDDVNAQDLIARVLTLIDNLDENYCDDNFSSFSARVCIYRLTAETKFLAGNKLEALDYIKQAILILGKIFPDSYNIYAQFWRCQRKMSIEEKKCLHIGSLILYSFNQYEQAYQIGKIYHKMLGSDAYEFSTDISAMSFLLLIASKTENRKVRIRRWTKQVIPKYEKRLMTSPLLSIKELYALSSAQFKIINVLLETNELTEAANVGIVAFRVFKEVHGEKHLLKILPLLILVFYHQKMVSKCWDMINHLQNAFQQCGDFFAEAMYHSLMVTAINIVENKEYCVTKMRMCVEFANSKSNVHLFSEDEDCTFFCCSKMALCSYLNSLTAFEDWYNRSLNCKGYAKSDSYWSLSAHLSLIFIQLKKLQDSKYLYSASEASAIRNNAHKELAVLAGNVVKFVPVLLDELQNVEKLHFYSDDSKN